MNNQTFLPPFIFIIGLGKSGLAVASFCQKMSIPAAIYDDNPKQASKILQENNLHFDLLPEHLISTLPRSMWAVVAPGIKPTHSVLKTLHSQKIPVISEIELGLRYAQEKSPNLIAITGTNGKTTVTQLVTQIFNDADISARSVGNIGIPFVEALLDPWPEWFVIELSSFQLENTFTPLFSVATWLNISPDHLDWHLSWDSYFKAKQKICTLLKPDAPCFCHESIPLTGKGIFSYGEGKGCFVQLEKNTIFFNKKAQGTIPPTLTASHDRENYLAAWSVAHTIGIDTPSINQSITTFTKPDHRIQFVAEKNGIQYWDDSKGTNIEASLAAIDAVPGPIVLIAGGVHKGSPYTPWKKFQDKIIAIVAIGEAKEKIAQDVNDSITVLFAGSLQQAIHKASLHTPHSVLLSPGCSSFDMFSNYKERGRVFQECVNSLA